MYIDNPPQKKALSVSELNRQVRSLLENSFLQIRVQGEISNFSRPASGHWYFTLKDDKAQVRCAMFRNRNTRVRFQPKEGDQIVLTGRVSLYEGRGDFQMIGNDMEADGEGQLQREFEALKTKLMNEGLFDPAFKRPLPEHPERLAVITSPTGAALHDVLSVLKRRFPSLEVTVYPSSVQGNLAEQELIQALRQVQRHEWADVIILGRGGGSLEDLWPFNSESLAREIYHCPIPIISAVGHEVDFSIADFVADVRAPTPSAAAEIISPDQNALRIRIDQLYNRLNLLTQRQIDVSRHKLSTLSSKLRHPGERVTAQKNRLSSLENRLNSAIQARLTRSQHTRDILDQRLHRSSPQYQLPLHRNRLERLQNTLNERSLRQMESCQNQLAHLVTRLQAISPLATLERGYSITQTQSGQLITDANQLQTGEKIQTRVKEGILVSTVEEIVKQNADNSTPINSNDIKQH